MQLKMTSAKCRSFRRIIILVKSNCIQATVYPKKYAHGFCFAVLCCGYTLTDFPISIRLTSLALWQSNDCPSASKATPMNMDKYFMWIQYERLHNHNKAKHNKTVCIFLGIYCISGNNGGSGDCWKDWFPIHNVWDYFEHVRLLFPALLLLHKLITTVTSYECHGVSTHQPLDCLLGSLLILTANNTLRLCITGPLCGESVDDRWISMAKGPWMRKAFLCYDVTM